MIKVLNLYAGIGGNRKLWPDNEIEVTAIENVPEIAEVYKKFFPQDTVLIEDAHTYLLKHYTEYDFIWSSPPCPSHSFTNFFLNPQGIKRYPDMALYQEIIFLQTFYKGKWVVENVKSYYEPLIKPQEIGRHYFWANFLISTKKVAYQIGTFNRNASKETQRKATIREACIPELIDLHGLDLTGVNLKDKRKILRNCVLPAIGLHVFKCAFKTQQKRLVE